MPRWFSRTGVLPVVPDFSHLAAAPDWTVASRFDDEWTNLLFVGRIIPNKRIEDLVRIFHAYRTTINPRSRLLIVGAYSGFEKYLAMVQSVAARLGTPDVHFPGHVSNEELVAYYDVADLFLCASEHEGFCVPLIEAFHMGVPVVARAATAVPATLDGGGVLYEEADPYHVASIVDAVLSDTGLRGQVIAVAGRRAGAARSEGFRRNTAAVRRGDRSRTAGGRTRCHVRLLGSARRV